VEYEILQSSEEFVIFLVDLRHIQYMAGKGIDLYDDPLLSRNR
jgi:hypothetical protein